jgi:putative peptidoglycan binding protein
MFTDVDDYSLSSVRTALATLACMLIDWTEREDGGNYLLKPADCSDCDRHPIAVMNTAFDHSWAVEVDIKLRHDAVATDNQHDMPTHVARVWNRYGFVWGEDRQGPHRDWMHFEFMGAPADAIEFARAALRELAPGTMRHGSRGPAVAALQRRLNRDRPGLLLVDGIFGIATETAVRDAQLRRRRNLSGVADLDLLAALQLEARPEVA